MNFAAVCVLAVVLSIACNCLRKRTSMRHPQLIQPIPIHETQSPTFKEFNAIRSIGGLSVKCLNFLHDQRFISGNTATGGFVTDIDKIIQSHEALQRGMRIPVQQFGSDQKGYFRVGNVKETYLHHPASNSPMSWPSSRLIQEKYFPHYERTPQFEVRTRGLGTFGRMALRSSFEDWLQSIPDWFKGGDEMLMREVYEALKCFPLTQTSFGVDLGHLEKIRYFHHEVDVPLVSTGYVPEVCLRIAMVPLLHWFALKTELSSEMGFFDLSAHFCYNAGSDLFPIVNPVQFVDCYKLSVQRLCAMSPRCCDQDLHSACRVNPQSAGCQSLWQHPDHSVASDHGVDSFKHEIV